MFPELTIIKILDLLGTFAFAISGIRMAAGRDVDWFGAYVIGLVTAIGGGTVRDLLLGVQPFWMQNASYLVTTGIALLVTIVFKGRILRWGSTLFLFDTIGLGLFTVVGLSKSFFIGLPVWTCIVMGAITGCVGGILRDVLLNQVPLIFRKDIYALACVAGGLVFFLGHRLGVPFSILEVSAVIAVIIIRILAVRFSLHLPTIFKESVSKEKSE